MGLRGKIIGLFFIGFGLMAAIALVLLNTNLKREFEAIEHKQAEEQMIQLAHNINNELNRLQQINNDWARWDVIANFVQHPSRELIEHHIAPGAIETHGLKFVLVLDNQNKTLFADTFNSSVSRPENPALFEPVFSNVKRLITSPISEKTCGLDISKLGPVMVCWEPIYQSTTQDNKLGTFVIGQLIDNAVLKRIQDQSGIEFKLNVLEIDPALSEINVPAQRATMELENIEFSKSNPDILIAHLNNIIGQPMVEVQLKFSNEVSLQGAAMIGKLMNALLLITVLTGLTLLVGIHFLVIRRLRNMETELNSIWRNGRWAGRLNTNSKQNSDEINHLGNCINHMLTLIRQQVVVLELNAHTDSLTQIANRRSFDERLAMEISLHKRNQTPLSLLLLDVDYFKRYNDHYGHPAGDKVLRELGKILSQIACRPSDLPARIGGEEFAIILPGTDLEGAMFVAEKITKQLAKLQMIHADSPVSDYITASIGIAAAENEDVASFVQRADKATYHAKQTGRNKICLAQQSVECLAKNSAAEALVAEM